MSDAPYLLAKLSDATKWFEVLHTTSKSQTAIMRLDPGQSSGETPEAHKSSDQVLLLVRGALHGTIEDQEIQLKEGDTVTIRAGTRHRFTNRGSEAAVTFNVYSPPEYPADEKG